MVLACLGLPAAAESITNDFYRRLQDFDQHYQTFMNHLCHWPAEERCNTNLGTVDTKEFQKAREAAKRLFELEEKKS